MTEPPPRVTISGSVSQWEIYDAYIEDFERNVRLQYFSSPPLTCHVHHLLNNRSSILFCLYETVKMYEHLFISCVNKPMKDIYMFVCAAREEQREEGGREEGRGEEEARRELRVPGVPELVLIKYL